MVYENSESEKLPIFKAYMALYILQYIYMFCEDDFYAGRIIFWKILCQKLERCHLQAQTLEPN